MIDWIDIKSLEPPFDEDILVITYHRCQLIEIASFKIDENNKKYFYIYLYPNKYLRRGVGEITHWSKINRPEIEND